MVVLVLGCFLLLGGVLLIRFPQFVALLRDNEPEQWQLLGAPPAHSFSKAIGVFNWVLARGYERCHDSSIVCEGRVVYRKALLAKQLMLAGVAFIVVGFCLQLFLSI